MSARRCVWFADAVRAVREFCSLDASISWFCVSLLNLHVSRSQVDHKLATSAPCGRMGLGRPKLREMPKLRRTHTAPFAPDSRKLCAPEQSYSRGVVTPLRSVQVMSRLRVITDRIQDRFDANLSVVVLLVQDPQVQLLCRSNKLRRFRSMFLATGGRDALAIPSVLFEVLGASHW